MSAGLLSVVFRLHRRGEQEPERHRWQEGHQCCHGCWEEVLSLSPCIQTPGWPYGHSLPPESPQSGASVTHPLMDPVFTSDLTLTSDLHSNWPTTSGTPCQLSAASCSPSCWLWTRRPRNTGDTDLMTHPAKPSSCCSQYPPVFSQQEHLH